MFVLYIIPGFLVAVNRRIVFMLFLLLKRCQKKGKVCPLHFPGQKILNILLQHDFIASGEDVRLISCSCVLNPSEMPA